MTFIIDAHLTPHLTGLLKQFGYQAIHVSALAAANATPDVEITSVAEQNDYVVVTKDYDFRESQLTHGVPSQLLLVIAGNLSRKDTLVLFRLHLAEIVELLQTHSCVELGHFGVSACS